MKAANPPLNGKLKLSVSDVCPESPQRGNKLVYADVRQLTRFKFV